MVAGCHIFDETKLQDHHDQHKKEEEGEDEEETLSLCDLPIYSDSFKWDDDFSSTTTKLDDQDLFEFFSSDGLSSSFVSSNPSSEETDIVFCGKVIPYDHVLHQQITHQVSENQKQKQKKKNMNKNKKKKRSIFEFLVTRNRKPSSSNHEKPCGVGFPVGKAARVSVMAASSSPVMVKPRWYLFAFGIVRFPTEMELRDMRTRQSRQQSSATMFPSLADKEETSKEKAVMRRRRKGRVWGLLRALRWGNRHVEKEASGSTIVRR